MEPTSIAHVASIYSATIWIVGIILTAAAFGSAIGWAMIASKYLESITRQPELRSQLTGQMLFTGGLMEAFPMIVLGISMFFTFANPFAGAFLSSIGAG